MSGTRGADHGEDPGVGPKRAVEVPVAPMVACLPEDGEGDATVTALDRGWFALRTRPRHERAAAGRLAGSGLEVFLPEVSRRRRWSDRIKTISEVLFPGYVFCRFAPAEFPLVRSTAGVLYVAPVACRPVRIPPEEIQSLRIALTRGVHLEPVRRLVPGDPVEVLHGPLRGVRGRLVAHKDAARLIVAVDLLQQGVMAEVSIEDVSPL